MVVAGAVVAARLGGLTITYRWPASGSSRLTRIMAIDYVSADTTKLYASANGTSKRIELLWGDRVRTSATQHGRTRVQARGVTGWVDTGDLGGQSLLEFYFVDVGQGDGVLIRTPDHRHVLIDGGYRRHSQDTGKNAADFVDWKFFKDYGQNTIKLDAIVTSHNDADHYGGLWDLLDPNEDEELDCTDVQVEVVYHAGVSWWRTQASSKTLGPKSQTSDGSFLTWLLEDRSDVLSKLNPSADPRLQGYWSDYFSHVVNTKRFNGTTPTKVERVSHLTKFLPGFGPGQAPVPGQQPGDASIKVLAPVEYEINGQAVLRSLGGSSKNTNGNSVLLRVDYGRSRILLTGDLNAAAQRFLLEDYEGERLELQCDVAKACHHGSEDVSYEFLAAMSPSVTVISSGDNEGHDHPRPNIIAASATTGHLEMDGDSLVSPLIYSTELARSVSYGEPTKLTNDQPAVDLQDDALDDVKIEYKETRAGDLNPRTRTKKLGSSLLVANLIYGLVNVRTDGETILCATRNEKDVSWEIKKVKSRF